MRESYKGIKINCAKNTHNRVFDLVTVPKNGTLVDIPSGAGAFVLRLKDAGYSKIFAVDIQNILAIDHSDFRVGDMTKPFPFDDQSVDAITCIDGIEHIDTQQGFIREAARVLRPGGELIISTPNINSLRSRLRWLLTSQHHKCVVPLDENNPTPLHHIAMISYQELRYFLHTNGLRIDAVTANRIKGVSWLYSPLVPFAYLATFLSFRKHGRKEGSESLLAEIIKVLFSAPVLFGETLIIRARKI